MRALAARALLVSSLLTFPLTTGSSGQTDLDDIGREEEIKEEGGVDAGGVESLIEYTNTRGGEKPRDVTPSGDRYWKPPACWYEPRTSSEVRDYVHWQSTGWEGEGELGPTQRALTKHYERDPYDNYNLDIEDEGYFWFGVTNPERRGEPEAGLCSTFASWVARDDSPDQDLAITPEIMAQSAYDWLPLPETEIELSPAADVPQVVNLPTWIWAEAGELQEVSATATLERLGLEATTTAVPTELALSVDSDDVRLHPADGLCTIGDDGTIGTPWTSGEDGTEPPCGVTFLRAGGERQLTASVTWAVSWTGTGHPEPQELPSATLETVHHLTVEEVQSIVR